ncbi:hypothetical protein OF83DRAFT_394973 [Amylostereum chailletii]|nr:hypothetical protein OF83DRAFT_394973 [Amylostereum chailletii]
MLYTGVYDTELKQYKRPKDHVKDLFSKMDLRIVFRGVNSEAATLWIPAVDFMLYVYNSTSSDSISLHCPIVETSWEAGVFGANFFRSVFFAGYDPEDPNQDPYVKLAPQYQNESQDYTFVS